VIERQIYATQDIFPVRLTIKTNDNQTFSKDFQLLVRDPAAVIKVDKTVTNVGVSTSFGVESYFADGRNVEYSWQIQNEQGDRVIRSANGPSLTYTFTEIGSYIVTLNARSPNGGTDSDSVVINVESREPIAALDAPRAVSSERPNTFLFDASKSYDPDTNSRQGLTYTWRLNGQAINLDNASDNGAKGSLTFENTGENTISVTVANTFGKIATAEQKFSVTSLLAVNLIITPQVTQINKPVNFIAQSPNADFFEWNF